VNQTGNLQSPALQPGLWMGLNRPDSRLGDLDLVVVGAPYDGGVSHAAGAAEAPAVLRSISSRAWPHTENLIDFSGLRLRDRGDVALTNLDATSAQLGIRSAVEPIVEAGVIPLVLGGDHSITSAVLSAYPRTSRMGILWMDSHPDLMDTFGAIRGKEESRWSHACPLRRILELPICLQRT
jgi:arginase family enzyme